MSFQSTHPCGVRQERSLSADELSRFNPRTPAGCDYYLLNVEPNPNRFQSTHPCGVRRASLREPSPILGFQSTHPCGVRHMVRLACQVFLRKFQSTHPCGVRLYVLRVAYFIFGFQSTHPCGVRPGQPIHGPISTGVSIHAPLRGATWIELNRPAAALALFQSTHPCGVRRCSASMLWQTTL